jgi:hypothetical protein
MSLDTDGGSVEFFRPNRGLERDRGANMMLETTDAALLDAVKDPAISSWSDAFAEVQFERASSVFNVPEIPGK